MTKILACASVRQDAAVLEWYLKSLQAQLLPPEVTLEYAFLMDMEGHDDREEAYKLCGAVTENLLEADRRDARAVYAIGAQTHEWSVDTFEHLAKGKQRLITYALERGYDYVWFCDTDLLAERTTLRSLQAARVNISNAVFWTAWMDGDRPLPQTWLSHPYVLSGLGLAEHDYLAALTNRRLVRVAGGGACVLVSADTLAAGVRYHPRLPGLPDWGMWQGEDRTFAITAQQLHIPQYADGWPDIFHAYHPHQRSPDVLASAYDVLTSPRQQRATYGDFISLRLTPLEDPQFQEIIFPEAQNIRGRLGQLKLAPELEAAALEMEVGESRIVDVFFPQHSPVANYRNSTRAIWVELVDIKPYGAQPVLAEHVFAGLQDEVA